MQVRVLPIRNMINKGLFSSNSSEWATPTDFYKSLDAEFHFNLDPCCTHENAKCERHYTIEDDGLTQKWGGAGTRVFCNPPYGREIGKWVKKCYEESKYIYHKAREIRFIRGRLHFNDSKQGAPFPSMVVVF